MKKLMISVLILSCLSAQADNLALSVKNFNFGYESPLGSGSATYFGRSWKTVNEPYNVSVEKIGESFHFLVTGMEETEYEYLEAASFLLDAERIQVLDLNLSLEDKVDLSLVQGRFYGASEVIKIDGLTLSCERNPAYPNLDDQLISGCIQKMSIKTEKFSIVTSKNDLLINLLTQSIVQAVTSGLVSKSDVSVKNLSFKLNLGQYGLSADVKADVSGKVKSHGLISYNHEQQQLVIKISEVKFGFFNITGKVFDELKKHESEKLRVKEPYLYLMK